MVVLAAGSTSVGELIAKVLPLAVGAAISPTILVVALLVLGSPSHPRSRGVAYAAGAITVLLVLSAISLTLLRRSVVGHKSSDPIYGWIDIGFGVLIALVGLRELLTAPKPRSAPAGGADQERKLGRFYVIGFVMMLSNFSTLVLYVPAMKDVAVASVGVGAKVVVVVMVLAIASVLAWAPVLMDLVAPRAAGRVLNPLDAFMTRHQKEVTVTVCFVFTVVLIAKGARAL
ncbi:MAG: GAP family protein [Acidimicrobiia bacterium]